MNYKTLEAELKKQNWRTFRFDSDTVLDSAKLAEIRENPHLSWHLYCESWWAGDDLSVFKPVADSVKKISLPVERGIKVIGIDCLVNLAVMSISGDVSEVDFTKFSHLRHLSVNESCRQGNWHLCESLNYLLIDVPTVNLKKLKALKNLWSLSVGRGLKSFEGVADLPALRELRVGGCHLPSIESLGDLPELRLLLLNLMPKLANLKGIEGLPNLEDLSVTQCGALRDVSAISTLTKLMMLELNCCPHIRSLNSVKLPTDCAVDFIPKGKVGDAF